MLSVASAVDVIRRRCQRCSAKAGCMSQMVLDASIRPYDLICQVYPEAWRLLRP